MVCWNTSPSMKSLSFFFLFFFLYELKELFPHSISDPWFRLQELVENKIIRHIKWRQSLTNVSYGLFTMLAAKVNPPLLFHKLKLYLDYGKVILSKHWSKQRPARDVVGKSMLCPLMSAYNNSTFCSCHHIWQKICLFEVENNYNSSIWVIWVWAVGFALFLSVRACYEHQNFINLSGLDLPSCKDAAATWMNSSLSLNAHFL